MLTNQRDKMYEKDTNLLPAELQKVIYIAQSNILPHKNSTKKWPKIAQKWSKIAQIGPKRPKIAKMAQKWPQMAQKLAPAEKKNSTDISAASATFCISGLWNLNGDS